MPLVVTKQIQSENVTIPVGLLRFTQQT